MKILSVVGARPQFIKAAPVSRALRRAHREILVHTGQHYDFQLSQVFFQGLQLPEPDHNLDVGSGSHAAQTARMLTGIERIALDELPDFVLIYGDTNSTLAGALAAAKLNIPVAHVEAGLRSFNRAMPEEINRVVADHLSARLFCPTHAAVENLRREGLTSGVHLVGDVMFDVARAATPAARDNVAVLERFGVQPRTYLLATIHRAGNTDDPAKLSNIVDALTSSDRPVVLPLHPRTRRCLAENGLLDRLTASAAVRLSEPLSYLDFLSLLLHAEKVLTDSGGVQKEACFHRVPCITLREETEWVETVAAGWNVLVGADVHKIREEIARPFSPPAGNVSGSELWDGRAAERIAALL